MGEYVININWSGGKGSDDRDKKLKTYLNGTSLLPAAALDRVFDENSITPDTFYGMNNIQDGTTKKWEIIKQGVVLSQVNRFFWSRQRVGTKSGEAYGDYDSFKDVPETAWQWSEEEKLKITTIHRRTIAYTAAQAIRLANLGFATHYQYASAIASSTAELNAVNDYQNAMTGIGLAGSIAAGTAVGAKVGSIGGPVGTAIGAGIGAAVATINKAVGT